MSTQIEINSDVVKYLSLNGYRYDSTIDELIKEELNKINKKFKEWKEKTGDKSLDHVSFDGAAQTFKDMITKKNFDDFLTLPLYEKI